MRFYFRVICAVFVILFSIINVCAAENREAKKVLILYSHKNPMPYSEILNKAIVSTLESDKTYRFEYYIEYMDISRFSGGGYLQRILDSYRQKYSSRKMDLLIAVGVYALDFLLKYRGELFPETPIIFCGLRVGQLSKLSLGPNMNGIAYDHDMKRSMDMALKLHPGTQRVIVIAGAGKAEQSWVAAARKAFRGYEDNIAFTYLTDLPMKDLLKVVGQQLKHTIIYYLFIFKDGAGKSFTGAEALSLISQASNSPIYGHFDNYLGIGVVGGYMINFEAQGRRAGELGLRILRGENLANIPVTEKGTNSYMFDWRQLKRWGINEGDLPPDSIVRFKELTTWGAYKWYIIGGISLFIIEAILILLLLFNWARRLRAESALRKSHKDLELRVEERTAELSKTNEQLKEEIDERKQMEVDIKKSAERFERWMSSNFIGIIQSNSKGDVIDANDTMLNMLGYSKQELSEGKLDWTELTPAEFLHLDQKAMEEASEKGTWTPFEKEYFHKDGHRVPILIGGSLFKEVDDEYIVFIIDLTENKKAEEALRESEEKLARSQKMEAMGLMAGGVAHDLNNILSGIVSYPELLLVDLPEDSPLRNPIKTIQESGMRAADVVEDLLTIARGVTTSKEVLNLNTMIEEYMDSADQQKLEKIHPSSTFKTEFDPELLNITCSASHVKKILMK